MKNYSILTFCLLAVLLFSNFTQSSKSYTEEVTISGTVTDESGERLIGANIMIVGTETGTISDLDGNYKLIIPIKDEIKLECSYTGFIPQQKILELKEKTKITCDFSLSSGSLLDEVVVVGYGTTKKSKISTSSSARISASRKREKRKAKKKKIAADFSPSSITGYADTYIPAPKVESERKSVKKLREEAKYAYEGMEVKEKKSAMVVPSAPELSAGTLTAGEIHDFSKWELWNDLSEEDLNHWKTHWNYNLTNRYSVQVMTNEGFPIIDAKVELINDKKTIWASRTDNTGKAELWSNIFEAKDKNKRDFSAKISYNGQTKMIGKLTKFQDGMNFIHLEEDCDSPDILDVLFVVDATSSMSDEMQYLQAEMYDVIGRTQNLNKDMTINLGSVFYRDNGDEYVTKQHDLTSNITETVNFLKAQRTGGGGDYPEAVETALDVAINQISWSEKTVAKLLFLVLDAPPHHTPDILKKLETLTQKAAQKGIRIIPIASSGINKSTEYLLRSFALSSNGTYVFLTDDSGVGNAHIEPSTDEYSVEKLNDLLIRVIKQFTEITNCKNQNDLVDNFKKDEPKDIKKDKHQLKVFPNPTTGIFKVELKKSVQELFITDLAGKILFRFENVQKGETTVNLENYPSGMYFVRFMDEEKAITEKVILAREVGFVAGK